MLLLILVCLVVGALAKQHHHSKSDSELERDRERIRHRHDDDWSNDEFQPSWEYVVAALVVVGIPFSICCCGVCICRSGVETVCVFKRAIQYAVHSVLRMIYLLFYGIIYVVSCGCCCCKNGQLGSWKARTKVAAVASNIEVGCTTPAHLVQSQLSFALGDKGFCLECSEERAETVNSLNIGYKSPYCAAHQKDNRGKYATELEAFEANDDYPCNYRFTKKLANVVKEMRRVVLEFRDNPVEPGFIYMFSHKADDDIAAQQPQYKDVQFVLRKIGMTRLESASARVEQWREKLKDDGSSDRLVFGNQQNQDWWRTSNAPLAEALVHALLINRRFVRFNRRGKPNGSNEIEWFYGELSALRQSIRVVVNAVNQGTVQNLLVEQKPLEKK